MKHLKKFNEDYSNDLMSDEEVKSEVLQKIKELGETSSRWSSRDTLKKFTNWEFWSGDVMAIIDIEIARRIADELYNYTKVLNPGDVLIDKIYELI